MGQPYWRSVMGYMCEMRDVVKQHLGVCASLLGREGPDQARVSGLTILPEAGTGLGAMMVLLFLPAGCLDSIELIEGEGDDISENQNSSRYIGARVRLVAADGASGEPESED